MVERGLQDEIKKRNPFDSPEQEVALNLARTADRHHGEFARLFKGHGITGAQYNVLRILRGAGEALPCQEISGRMIAQLPDITRLVDRLEDAGLVERAFALLEDLAAGPDPDHAKPGSRLLRSARRACRFGVASAGSSAT